MTESDTGVVDLTTVAQSFPELDPSLIRREHFVDAMTELFSNGADVVLLEGAEQSGRTILAAQFARKHKHRAISLFLRGSSRFGQDPIYLRQEIGEQISWIVRPDAASQSSDLISEEEFTTLVFTLQRRARRQPFYFVIDGLDRVAADHGLHEIMRMLPFGFPGLKALVTVKPDHSLSFDTGVAVKSFPMTGFTFEEAKHFLNDPRLKDVAVTRFRNQRFIRHEGYRVAAEAQALRIGKLRSLV
jgi:hypothetical protein